MEIYRNNHRDLQRGACSTVIIGKRASVTGKVIIGHNEDDEGSITQYHLVPRIKHAPGETIQFDDAAAVIPQVEETLAYLWTDVKCEGGISFADTFVNECGLAIVTNACRESRDATGAEHDNWKDYTLGYGLRRLVAERAHNAREAVKIAAGLIEKYGYTSSRAYHFADKEEAWVLNVGRGYVCAARRVGDDEVYYVPNHYTIGKIDFNDPDNYYWSDNLVTFAVEQGWYTPAKEGDYSDFDYAKAYQAPEPALWQNNINRATNAWLKLAGIELKPEEVRFFSRRADRKFSPEDVKDILRSHGQGTPYDMTEGETITPHRHFNADSICNNATIESTVFVFNEDPYLLRMLRTSAKPCTNPYIPYYPLVMRRIPEGYEWDSVATAQHSHFNFDESELRFDHTKAWFEYKIIQMVYDYNYPMIHRPLKASIALIEAGWEKEKDAVEDAYRRLKETDPEAAKDFLSDYTLRQVQKTREWAKDTITFFGNDFWREEQY